MDQSPHMSIRIGINGFGRMGRLALRAGWGRPGLEFVHVNELKGGPETAAHLLMFDSVHGRWNLEAGAEDGALRIGGTRVTFTAHDTPADIPWHESGVDIVLECSGKFKTTEALRAHLARGPKTVIAAAPVRTAPSTSSWA